jgi:hypothetical protein
MKTSDLDPQIEAIASARLDRRKFFRTAGAFGLGAAASGFALSSRMAEAQENTYQGQDTFAEIVTAFLIAEDLASTFYYNGLTGPVVQDPSLAGPGGSYRNITTGDVGNVGYLRAALTEECAHAVFFRTFLTGQPTNIAADPHQTFYFPTGTFDSLPNFLGILDALENAFIGAYMVAIQELAYKATLAAMGSLTGADANFHAKFYILMAKRCASILGIEAEHRTLGRDLAGAIPANNLTFEQTAGITSIYNGPASAVVALTPFLTASTGPGYPLYNALTSQHIVGLPTTGGSINA